MFNTGSDDRRANLISVRWVRDTLDSGFLILSPLAMLFTPEGSALFAGGESFRAFLRLSDSAVVSVSRFQLSLLPYRERTAPIPYQLSTLGKKPLLLHLLASSSYFLYYFYFFYFLRYRKYLILLSIKF